MNAPTVDSRGAIVACQQCGQKTRIPFNHLQDTGRCTNCRAAIPPPSLPLRVKDASDFDALTSKSKIPVVVDFWAEWCAPCKMMEPDLEAVAAEESGKVAVAKVNTEEVPALAQRFSIRSIPTLMIFRDGEQIGHTAGAHPKADLKRFIRDVTGNAAS